MTLASQFHPLRSLVLIAQRGTPIELKGLTLNDDGTLVARSPATPLQFRFRFGGRDFKADLVPKNEGFSCRLAVLAGSIPFSVENPHGRCSVLELLRVCQHARPVRFQAGTQQSLWLLAEADSTDSPSPDAVLIETAKLVGVMRPYLDLASAYLLKQRVPKPTIVPGSTRTH